MSTYTSLPPTAPIERRVRSERVRRSIAVTLKYSSLIFGVVVVVLPLLAIFMTSLKTDKEMVAGSGALTPPDSWFYFDNYVTAFKNGKMITALGNTAYILFFSIIGTVFIGTLTAYAIDRFDFRFKRVVVALFLIATLVPGVTTQVATFQVVEGMGLFNTRWAAILLYMGTDIIAIYIFLQFIRSIPVALDEAARIEGASTFKIYRSIILPLLKPAIATVVIVKGVFVYNDFYIPFLYMPSGDLGVISTALFRFRGPFGAQFEVIAAGTALVIIPTLIAFIALQRYIYNGFTEGAAK